VTSLHALLAGQPVGSWAVLDHDMTRILATGPTPEEAIRAARPLLAADDPGVVVQVRDWMAET
jgi:hypothetical protein